MDACSVSNQSGVRVLLIAKRWVEAALVGQAGSLLLRKQGVANGKLSADVTTAGLDLERLLGANRGCAPLVDGQDL